MPKLNTPKSSLTILALLLGIVLTGGGRSVFIKIGLREIPLFTFNFLRLLLAAMFILPFFLREKPSIDKGLSKIILTSLLAIGHINLFALGVARTTATIATMLYASVPIIAAVFSTVLLQEKINLRKIIGIIIGFVGALLIILSPALTKNSMFTGDLIGNILTFSGVIVFALYSVLSKQLQRRYSPTYITMVFLVTAAIIHSFISIFELKVEPQWWLALSLSGVIALLYVGVLATGVNYLLYQYTIKHSSPLVASLTFYLLPISTFAWGSLLLGEGVTLGFVVGAVLAFLGAWFVISN